MKSYLVWIFVLAFGIITACSSPQDKAYKAQEKVHTERLKLVEEYKKCLKKAGGDKEKTEACDQYLKAAEALQ